MKAYRITTREAETTVRLKDGETMVIGGLIGSQDSHSNKSVPFLSDLPILGSLFKNSSNEKTDTEVMIFLTPHIVT
jgi:type IV pilus assembly protein PilQ